MVGSLSPARWYVAYFAGYAELDERHDKGDPPLCPVGAPEAAAASELDGAGAAVAGDDVLEVPHHVSVDLHEALQIPLVINLPNPLHGLTHIVVRTVPVPQADVRGFPVLLAVCVVAAGLGEHVGQVVRVKDDAAGDLLQLRHGEALAGARGDVDVATAFGGAAGQFEDPVPGGPEVVDFLFPVSLGAEDWGDGF